MCRNITTGVRMRLILIRHGESEHALRGIIAGFPSCTGLTARGREQARALADRLSVSGELRDVNALLSSPVLRARQTAEVLAGVLPAVSIEEDCDLCELHWSEAEGMSWEAYRETYGTFDLVTSPSRPVSPGGDSWQDFLSRMRGTLDRLTERFDGQTVVAVSHAAFIVASILVIFGIPRPGTGARLDPAYTSLTEWCVSGATWQLVRYNDAYHLLGG